MAVSVMTHDTGTRGRVVATPLPVKHPNPSTAKLAPGARADVVAGAAESPAIREIDPAHRARADRRTEARITAVLGNVDAIRTRAKNVYVSVSDGIVTLFGAVRDSGAAREIENTVRTSTRIGGIQNNILMIGPRVSD